MLQAQSNNIRFYYRYKLNENSESESKMIRQNELSKKWTIFPNEVKEFKDFIRTKDRPTGIIDYEMFDRFTEAVHKSSIVDFNKRFPMYSREILASMPRTQLVSICNAYNISTVNKRPDFLINQILTKQDVYREEQEQRDKEERKQLMEQIAEEKVNEVLDKRLVVLEDSDKAELKKNVIDTLKKKFK